MIHTIHDIDGNRITEYVLDDGAPPQLLREYIWLDGMVVAVVENEQLYFVRTDHIHRPVFATDATGTKVWEATYLPFGGVHTTTGDTIALRFPGQWFQSESGLHQNWMRDYDPVTGRYLQADPLGLVDGASVYNYALQNPGRYIDPRGEFVERGGGGGGGDGGGGETCQIPEKCLLYRAFDGPGLKARGYPLDYGKLCVYACYSGYTRTLRKQTYTMRYVLCPPTALAFTLMPISPAERVILSLP